MSLVWPPGICDKIAAMDWFSGFEGGQFAVDSADPDLRLFARYGGKAGAPPLLLLHGYPQSHVLWHRVAQQLRDDFFLVMPDLRGYGDSAKPAGLPDHANYSKRVMAQDMVVLMHQLGFERFFVAGHDRGGRVAHRLALDHPQRVRKLCVIDIAPTLAMYEATDMAFARAYYHWFYLIQPAPLPERQIGADPKFYLHWTLSGWGARGLDHIEPQALAEYERCFCTPAGIHGACEDYRAAAGIDLEHDRASRAAAQRVQCELLVLWGERGIVHQMFRPLDEWGRVCAAPVQGRPLPAGHFIPEELPAATAQQLRAFFAPPA